MSESQSARVAALESLAGLVVSKGHGTGNDFVIVPDLHDRLVLGIEQVRALCDRHRGIGADGVLRVAPTESEPEVADQTSAAAWFMDYRNADGSIAEMCGNGARVFAQYLVRAGLERGTEFAIATRGGVRNVVIHEEGDISVEMGIATTPRARAMPVVSVDSQSWTGVGVLVPNPHCVVFLDDESSAQRSDSHGDIGLSSSVLSHLDLSNAPDVGPAAVFPDGVNVEFVRRIGSIDSRHLLMRVHERGVGETLACGTGACAVMWAAAVRDEAPEVVEYTVEMPGGTVTVRRDAEGHLHLRGPAVIVGSITLGAQVVPLV